MPSLAQDVIDHGRSEARPRRLRGNLEAFPPAAPYPVLFELNTRVHLAERAHELGRPATLDDITEADLDAWAQSGFDWIWLLGVCQTGTACRQVSLSNDAWLAEYKHVLPDLRPDDVCGSCFAIKSYTIAGELGGEPALARLREKLEARCLRLMLDFVPNHTALDHPWVSEHPNYYVTRTLADLERELCNYWRAEVGGRTRILAHGRDPYFAGWPDTLQLNYGDAGLQSEMGATFRHIASLCDGVRCDMAMLILPDVFERTWHIRMEPFWPMAIVQARQENQDFIFMAEAYWDLE